MNNLPGQYWQLGDEAWNGKYYGLRERQRGGGDGELERDRENDWKA